MKINWLEFEDLSTGLKCNKVCFNNDVTLLVGLSGVGKTQILNAITTSFKYAISDSPKLHPYKATLNFTVNNKIYEWSYEVSTSAISDLDNIIKQTKNVCEFVYEEVKCNDTVIMKRDKDTHYLHEYKEFPVPKSTVSLLSQYSSDPHYSEIANDFIKLSPLDIDYAVRGLIEKENFIEFTRFVKDVLSREENFDFFRSMPTIAKIYVAKRYFNDIYIKIFDYVKELFPEISDIDVVEDNDLEAYVIAVTVYNQRLLHKNISNGMLKTIYYIVELVTTRPNTVVLIDEFENGLGVNCIDVLSELLLSERNDLQFIITSHHPKIINQIEPTKWRIIERELNVVNNISSDDFGIGNSRHNAYFNLINRWEFEGKI